MKDKASQKILVAAPRVAGEDDDLAPRRRGEAVKKVVNQLTAVDLSEFQGQVNLFIEQMSQVVNEAPRPSGEFRMTEFEVSVGLQVEAGGKLNLFLVAEGAVKGALTTGLKFVFKRT